MEVLKNFTSSNSLKVGDTVKDLDDAFHKILPYKSLNEVKIKKYCGSRELKFAHTPNIQKYVFNIDDGKLFLIRTKSRSQSEKMHQLIQLQNKLRKIGLYPKISRTLIFNIDTKDGDSKKNVDVGWIQIIKNKQIRSQKINDVLRKISELKYYDLVETLNIGSTFDQTYLVKHYKTDKNYLIKVLIADPKLNGLKIEDYLEKYKNLVKKRQVPPLALKTPVKYYIKLVNINKKVPVYFLLLKGVSGSLNSLISQNSEGLKDKISEHLKKHFVGNFSCDPSDFAYYKSRTGKLKIVYIGNTMINETFCPKTLLQNSH
jgi:hypothetical protein